MLTEALSFDRALEARLAGFWCAGSWQRNAGGPPCFTSCLEPGQAELGAPAAEIPFLRLPAVTCASLGEGLAQVWARVDEAQALDQRLMHPIIGVHRA